MEQWKEIDGYEGLYMISNKGNVKSITFRRSANGIKTISKADYALNPVNNGKGYLYVGLVKDGKRKNHYIHRLVAEAFIPNQMQLKEVNHKDYDKSNNSVENLEWCSRKYNVCHSSCNMKKQHFLIGKSGIRYIGIDKKGRYRVNIPKSKTDKRFRDINEAIKYRNEVLNEIGYTI